MAKKYLNLDGLELVVDRIKEMLGDGVVSPIVPDYANMENVNRITTKGGIWAADRDGFVYVRVHGLTPSGQDSNIVCIINGSVVMNRWVNTESANDVTGLFPVNKGDVVCLDEQIHTLTDWGSVCYFIPPVAVVPPLANSAGGDWQQNDPQGSGYIQNRTHWKEEANTNILDFEQEVEWGEPVSGGYETLLTDWVHGREYRVIARVSSGIIFEHTFICDLNPMGNREYWYEGDGFAFWVVFPISGNSLNLPHGKTTGIDLRETNSWQAINCHITVSEENTYNYHKLDENYMPDTVTEMVNNGIQVKGVIANANVVPETNFNWGGIGTDKEAGSINCYTCKKDFTQNLPINENGILQVIKNFNLNDVVNADATRNAGSITQIFIPNSEPLNANDLSTMKRQKYYERLILIADVNISYPNSIKFGEWTLRDGYINPITNPDLNTIADTIGLKSGVVSVWVFNAINAPVIQDVSGTQIINQPATGFLTIKNCGGWSHTQEFTDLFGNTYFRNGVPGNWTRVAKKEYQYSTDLYSIGVDTGKKWTDGKRIYEKVLNYSINNPNVANLSVLILQNQQNPGVPVDADEIIDFRIFRVDSASGTVAPFPSASEIASGKPIEVSCLKSAIRITFPPLFWTPPISYQADLRIFVRYTKTN